MKTRTGDFPIGFRRGWSAWQKELGPLCGWAKQNGFACLDPGGDGDKAAPAIKALGLEVGTVDLLAWGALMSPEKAKRGEAVARNEAYVAACAQAGVRNFFAVMVPENPSLPRDENFAALVQSLKALLPALERHGARVAIEGWPGPGAIICTPEGYRALFREIPSPSMAVNFHPSHMIRMGVDPLRFLEEFKDRVVHVHGKDTEILEENLYEYGHEQPATFAKAVPFGGMSWRYCIPGHGRMRWVEAFRILASAGYKGMVSVELEDAHFNVTEETEKAGLLAGARFLESC